MTYFSWLSQEENLSNGALTVRAQAVSPNDTGKLVWDQFFPRRDVDSVKLQSISQIDFRPTADRREWNARGRQIPMRTPNVAELEMIPIESFFTIGEREIQALEERTLGNQQLFRQLIGAPIPDRMDVLASANYRRIEVDALTAWALGQITVMNPVKGTTGTVSFGFDSARYETVLASWDATNAYDNFMAWLTRAVDLVGPIVGVQLRLADLNLIKSAAPNFFAPDSDLLMTVAQLEERIQDDMGSEFQFLVNENTQDIFTDGGNAVVRTKVWPTSVIAAVPAGEQVGYTAFAPVARAFEVSRAEPEAKIDIRGMTAYLETGNGGRSLTAECQVNALTIPDESKVAVIDITA